jgi:hypothetical protein
MKVGNDMITKGFYRDNKTGQVVEVIGETEFSHIADDPTAEHIGISHMDNGNAEVVFILDDKMITNNALGILVIFKKGWKNWYLPKKVFEGDFKVNKVSQKRFELIDETKLF